MWLSAAGVVPPLSQRPVLHGACPVAVHLLLGLLFYQFRGGLRLPSLLRGMRVRSRFVPAFVFGIRSAVPSPVPRDRERFSVPASPHAPSPGRLALGEAVPPRIQELHAEAIAARTWNTTPLRRPGRARCHVKAPGRLHGQRSAGPVASAPPAPDGPHVAVGGRQGGPLVVL
jgi:hypothetical protein